MSPVVKSHKAKEGLTMYLVLTEKCTMKCRHCCMAAGLKGRDMPLEVIRAATKLAEERGDDVTLGGGEPTMHPQFWEILGLVLAGTAHSAVDECCPPLVVTNGSQTETALKLAKLAKRGVLMAELSRDKWHDPIDPKVVQAFEKASPRTGGDYLYGNRNQENDFRGIRTVSRIVKAGRAKSWGSDDGCACETLFVAPDGALFACGCKLERFGTVFAPEIPDDYGRDDCCSKARAKKRMEETIEVLEPDLVA